MENIIYFVNTTNKAEKQVLNDLKAAQLVYNSELERIRRNFKLVTFDELIKLNNSLKESKLIKIIPTLRATPTGRLELQNVMAKSIILLYMGIIGGVSVLAAILAFIIAAGMTKHLTDMLRAMRTISEGILALAVVNAYALKEGLLGLINFKQRKAIDSVARNLDYLTTTVQKFLNLGVIERSNKRQVYRGGF